MSDEQSIRDEIANALIEGIKETSEVGVWVDKVLASPVIRRIQAEAWEQGVMYDRCVCAAWSEDECSCGRYGTVPTNPYRGEES